MMHGANTMFHIVHKSYVLLYNRNYIGGNLNLLWGFRFTLHYLSFPHFMFP